VKIKYSQSGSNLTITPPALTPASTPCNYAWVFKLKN
jgi:alpha-L-fucosidase